MKKYLVLTLLGVSMLAQATSYTLFSGLNCYNSSYSCTLPVTTIAPDQQITDCKFTFTSMNTYSGLLYCNLLGNNSSCSVGSKYGSSTSWTCTLDSICLDYLNNCISSGNCNFNLGCYGNWNIGSCQVEYTCQPKPNCSVPDSSTTIYMLGLALLALELSRRKLALAK